MKGVTTPKEYFKISVDKETLEGLKKISARDGFRLLNQDRFGNELLDDEIEVDEDVFGMLLTGAEDRGITVEEALKLFVQSQLVN